MGTFPNHDEAMCFCSRLCFLQCSASYLQRKVQIYYKRLIWIIVRHNAATQRNSILAHHNSPWSNSPWRKARDVNVAVSPLGKIGKPRNSRSDALDRSAMVAPLDDDFIVDFGICNIHAPLRQELPE